MTTCAPGETEKAAERALLLAQLARRICKAGHSSLVRPLLERAGSRDGTALEDVLRAAERLVAGEAAPPISGATTVRELGIMWTDGKLHERWPDHVKKKKHVDDDKERLARYVYPLVGDVALPDFRIEHAGLVMSGLPKRLSAGTRRHVAQVLSRVLNLAAYPCRIIPASPLPKGFLPSPGKRKALTFLYPDEDRALLGCTTVPLIYRVYYGVLAREGLRRGEAEGLSWRDVDLERGALTLDENKSDDPRAWALDPGVARALSALRARLGKVEDSAPIFVDDQGRSVASPAGEKGPARLRRHLREAGIVRAELFERSATRQPMRIHDLRATFITVSLANGRSESWVADRTGHTSSVMINRYRRAARRVEELGLGALAELDVAVPEL